MRIGIEIKGKSICLGREGRGKGKKSVQLALTVHPCLVEPEDTGPVATEGQLYSATLYKGLEPP